MIDVRYEDNNSRNKIVFEFSNGETLFSDVFNEEVLLTCDKLKNNLKTLGLFPRKKMKLIDEHSFKDNINFYNCIVLSDIYLTDNNLPRNISISNCILKKELGLLGLDIIGIEFLGTIFINGLHLSVNEKKEYHADRKRVYIKKCCFRSCILNLISLNENRLIESFYIEESIFLTNLHLNIPKVNYVTIEHSQFYGISVSYFEKITERFCMSQNEFFQHTRVIGEFDGYETLINNKYMDFLDLSNCKFNQKVNFANKEYNKVLFNYSEFSEVVDFTESTFVEVSFKETKFLDTCIFDETKFENEPDFTYTTFHDMVVFREAEFLKGINLSTINLRDKGNLNFFYKDFDSKVKDSSRDYLKDKKHELQETYRIIKNEYQKKNDAINAINIYKKECEYHYQSLSWCGKDFLNKLILFFEKTISSYGTNPFKALALFFIFNFMLYVGYIAISTNFALHENLYTWKGIGNCLEVILNSFIPSIISGEPIVYKPAWLKVIHFVISTALLYEIIKSFRKYSRKL
ncbi:pentapeptide repeat-containing protein [Pseudofrancisella aestuarii]|uniref:Pentapeptide repeat-containing protein n=1 Tax=Pseudofrancisella aestuarii TaxID=2670347 RepID=A0ABV9TBD2_9GAMM|nr:pentapeptide repeat-containing protein [Pseudofrancisella aestuarii]